MKRDKKGEHEEREGECMKRNGEETHEIKGKADENGR